MSELSTSTLRSLYGPQCTAKGSIYIEAYKALDAMFRKHGYRPRAGVTGAQNCRRITGGSGWSLHAYGPGSSFMFWTGVRISTSLAVDVNWDKNPYGPRLVTDMPRALIDDIYTIRTNSGSQVWRWGGYYAGSKDAMHFEVVCSPTDLATGIRGNQTTPVTEPGEEDMAIYADQLNRIELRTTACQNGIETLITALMELGNDIPDNLAAQLGEIRRNLRSVGAAVDAQNIE